MHDAETEAGMEFNKEGWYKGGRNQTNEQIKLECELLFAECKRAAGRTADGRGVAQRPAAISLSLHDLGSNGLQLMKCFE